MKRFVTYLYEYERGKKTNNIGFIRVNIRNEKTDMQIIIRNCLRTNEVGKIFALINKNGLLGIELGEIKIINGQSDGRIIFSTNNIMDHGYSVNEIIGVGIRLQNNDYFASCWKDEFAEEIVRGEFLLEDVLQEESSVEISDKEEAQKAEAGATSETQLAAAEEHQLYEPEIYFENEEWEDESDREVSYKKIDLTQIRDLPSPNWHLATNSFLVHGFWNYGYLVLKKEMEGGKETLSLGVPGIFEKPEAVMAILFGFPDFQEVPSEIKKNQEPKIGTFGCWFVNLQN